LIRKLWKQQKPCDCTEIFESECLTQVKDIIVSVNQLTNQLTLDKFAIER